MEGILALLRAHPAGLTSLELAQRLGWSRAAVGRTLAAMKRVAIIQGSGAIRNGAAVVELRTKPLQLALYRRKGRRVAIRKRVA